MSVDDITAQDIMTTDVVTLKKDISLNAAIKTLLSAKISGAPVTDDEGRLTGIVTEEDLIGVIEEHGFDHGDFKISSLDILGTTLIVKDVFAISPTTSPECTGGPTATWVGIWPAC